MKKFAPLFIFIYCLSATSFFAQVKRVGFGNFFAGPVYNYNSSLQNNLSAENLAGKGLGLNTTTYAYGGAGYTLRPRGFILGGSGYTYRVSSDGVNGNATLNVSGGIFNIGYLVLNKRKWMGFPYFGVGAFGSNFKITNAATEKILVEGTDSITPRKQAKYSTGGLVFDIGFGLKHFPLSKTTNKQKEIKGMIGIDAGASFFPAFGKWKNVVSDNSINSMKSPFTMAAYLRLTIGLGVFYDKEKLK